MPNSEDWPECKSKTNTAIERESREKQRKSKSNRNRQITSKRYNAAHIRAEDECRADSGSDSDTDCLATQVEFLTLSDHSLTHRLRAGPDCLTKFDLLRGGAGCQAFYTHACDLFDVPFDLTDLKVEEQPERKVKKKQTNQAKQHEADVIAAGAYTTEEAIRKVQAFERHWQRQAAHQRTPPQPQPQPREPEEQSLPSIDRFQIAPVTRCVESVPVSQALKAAARSKCVQQTVTRHYGFKVESSLTDAFESEEEQDEHALLPFDTFKANEVNSHADDCELEQIKQYSRRRTFAPSQVQNQITNKRIKRQKVKNEMDQNSSFATQSSIDPPPIHELTEAHAFDELLCIHDMRECSDGSLEFLVQWSTDAHTLPCMPRHRALTEAEKLMYSEYSWEHESNDCLSQYESIVDSYMQQEWINQQKDELQLAKVAHNRRKHNIVNDSQIIQQPHSDVTSLPSWHEAVEIEADAADVKSMMTAATTTAINPTRSQSQSSSSSTRIVLD